MSDKSRRGLILSALALGVQLAALGAQAQTPDERDTTTDRHAMPAPDRTALKNVTPQEFAKQATVIGKAEVELGKLAIDRSQDPEVRKFAEQMVRDHTAADAKLKRIASQEKLDLPQSLDPEHEALKQKLSGLKGEAFDREYKKAMAKDHDKAVALFESAAQTPTMPDDLKRFAASTLPTLEQHKDKAHALHEEGA